MTDYEAVIGLEIHAELLTQSKMFSACPVVDTTAAPPNTATDPVTLGMPGVLPVVNMEAVHMGLMVGLALHCEIPPYNKFDRKSYFYPDLPKGYQISQYDKPLAINGYLDVELADGSTKRIRVRRAHLEEDTGKSQHIGGGYSLVNLNRAGVPLMEIVTEPDIRSAEEAEAFGRKLRAILQYLGVSHGDMSKGVLRMEPNISVRPVGSDELRTRTEIKNLNSIRSVFRATEAEIERQIALYEAGGEVVQSTYGWDENKGALILQRVKESASDYRYFPEPDIPPLEISRAWVAEVQATLPELPDAKRERFMNDLGLGGYDAALLVAEQAVADYYEAALAAGGDAKRVANILITDLFRLMNADTINREDIGQIKVTPGALAALTQLVERGTVNNNTAKQVLEILYQEGGDPAQVVSARGLAQVTDESALQTAVEAVLDGHPEEVTQYLAGQEKVAKFLMGMVMRELRGKGEPQAVQRLLAEALEARR